MRLAVVGHVEWVEFARVTRVPLPGEIVHATDTWAEAAGGGGVAAVQLARLGGAVTLFTALGDDELGRRAHRELQALGVHVEAVLRPRPQRRAFTFVDDGGERTITVIGERMVPAATDVLPWSALARCDAVYFTGGDDGALRAARAARVLTATPRTLGTLRTAGVQLDALIGSGHDAGEHYVRGEIAPEPTLVVRTSGASGGTWEAADGTVGRFPPTPLPGAIADAYGCGDSFAAGLTYGLGARLELAAALDLAARCGAACLTGRGAYGSQLRSA